MALWIQISPLSKEPIYAQIVSQIAHAIAKGHILPTEKLPPVRNLAAELVINPNTVARAYSILEKQGLVTTKTGSGTFVTDPKLRSTDSAQLNILAERIDTLITQAVNLGLSPEKINDLLSSRLKNFTAKPYKGRQKK